MSTGQWRFIDITYKLIPCAAETIKYDIALEKQWKGSCVRTRAGSCPSLQLGALLWNRASCPLYYV
uniref:Uncharacterized protein n=1 Tax=Anguilla anguilla TaxID=7936 RepID=A0A0E9SLS4_ANGAN